MTQRDRLVTLVVVDSNVDVSVVSSDLDCESLTSTLVNVGALNYYCYKLPTDGTGMYKVVISDSDTGNKLDTVDLYVMSKLLAVESEIIVGSDGTN